MRFQAPNFISSLNPLASRSNAWCLRSFACWGCRFESRRRHGCLSLMSVLSGRGLCDGLVTGPQESYRVWCV
jgi:hypothetical protein